MIEILEIELNGLDYQVEVNVEVTRGESYYDDDNEEDQYDIDIVDIHLVRKKNVYKVTNEKTWDEINSLDLEDYYFDQCC
jgi:hypothetical protein